MRNGFTTGSCAAAAAKAAAYMLLTGIRKNSISITTPGGVTYCPDIVNIEMEEALVRCGVIKDGGDDPDITTGTLIMAEVSIETAKDDSRDNVCENPHNNSDEGFNGNLSKGLHNNSEESFNGNSPGGSHKKEVLIRAGEGIGTVTRPGLDQKVGSPAINSVPRGMIEREVREVMELCGFEGTLLVTISAPDGRELAEKTFNPKLGIEGGISILGTSGIVEPMSSKALIDTIRVELSQKKAMGYKGIAVSPGNYGLDFMKTHYGFDLERAVKCSNYIGDTIDMTVELGFESFVLIGDIGKLIKLSGGIMNTHSANADCRMELLAAAAILSGSDTRMARELLCCNTTREALGILKEGGELERTMSLAMDRIMYALESRAGGGIRTECIMFSPEFGLLAKSEGAEECLGVIATGNE